MFTTRFLTSFKKEKRAKARKVDAVAEQVRKILGKGDQRLILMVRG